MSNLWFFRLKRAEQQRRRSSGEQSVGSASIQSASGCCSSASGPSSLPPTSSLSALGGGHQTTCDHLSSGRGGGASSSKSPVGCPHQRRHRASYHEYYAQEEDDQEQGQVSEPATRVKRAEDRAQVASGSRELDEDRPPTSPPPTTRVTTKSDCDDKRADQEDHQARPLESTGRASELLWRQKRRDFVEGSGPAGRVAVVKPEVSVGSGQPALSQRVGCKGPKWPPEVVNQVARGQISRRGAVNGGGRGRTLNSSSSTASSTGPGQQRAQLPQVTIIRSDSTSSSFISMGPALESAYCAATAEHQAGGSGVTRAPLRKRELVSKLMSESRGLVETNLMSSEDKQRRVVDDVEQRTTTTTTTINHDKQTSGRVAHQQDLDSSLDVNVSRECAPIIRVGESCESEPQMSQDLLHDQLSSGQVPPIREKNLLNPNSNMGNLPMADSMDNLAALIPRVRVEFYNSENTLKEKLQLYFIKDHTVSLYVRCTKLTLKFLACYLYVCRVILDRGPAFANCYGCQPVNSAQANNVTLSSLPISLQNALNNLTLSGVAGPGGGGQQVLAQLGGLQQDATLQNLLASMCNQQPQVQQVVPQQVVQSSGSSKFDSHPYDGPYNYRALFWVDRGQDMWFLQTTIAVICFTEAVLMQYLTYKNNIFSIISFHFILELITNMPFIMSIFWTQLKTVFVPGFLNCWLAKQCLEAMLNDISIVRQTSVFSHRLTILSATVFCLIFTSACGFQHAQRIGGRNISIFESIYFVVVTFSTVGYGDFKPETWPSQLFIMVMICVALIVLPTQFEQLAYFWIERKKLGASYAHHSTRHEKHVVVCSTTLRADTIMDFLNEFYAHPLLQTFSVVLLSPCELDTTMKLVLQTPTWNNRVVYIQGSALKANDLIRARMQSAEACFILAARNYNDRSAADEHTILRSWAIRDFSPYVPQYVQIFRTENKIHVAFAEHVVCDDEFKYALLANNCLIPGTSTLVTLLLHTSQQQTRRAGRRGRGRTRRQARRARRRVRRCCGGLWGSLRNQLARPLNWWRDLDTEGEAASMDGIGDWRAKINAQGQATTDGADEQTGGQQDPGWGASGNEAGKSAACGGDQNLNGNGDDDDGDDESDDDDHSQPEWKRLYGKCSANEIYHIRLSDSRFFGEYMGKSFTYASFHSHRKFGVALIGVQTDMRGTWPIMLNPGPTYSLKPSDILFYINITKEENSALMPMIQQQQQQQQQQQAQQNILLGHSLDRSGGQIEPEQKQQQQQQPPASESTQVNVEETTCQQHSTYIRIEASSPTAGIGSRQSLSLEKGERPAPVKRRLSGEPQTEQLEAVVRPIKKHSVADGASIVARSLCSMAGVPTDGLLVAAPESPSPIDQSLSPTGQSGHAQQRHQKHRKLFEPSCSLSKRNSAASTSAAILGGSSSSATAPGLSVAPGYGSRNASTLELAAIATGLRKGSNISISSTRSRDASPTRLKQVVSGLAVKMKRVKLGKSLTHLTIPRMDLGGGGSSASSTESFVNARGRRPSIAPVPAMMGESEEHDSDHEREQESYFSMSWQSSSESSPIVKKFVFCTTYVGVSPTLCYLLQRKKPPCCLQLIQTCEHCPYKNARQYNWPNRCIILASDFASNGIYNFLVPLRAHFHNPTELRPIVLLLERKPSPQFIDAISWFPMVYWMPGSIDNLDDLIKAGINLAHSVVVTNKESTNSAEEDYLADCNTIVAVQTMFKMFPSVGIITELSQSSNMRFMQFRAHDPLFGGLSLATAAAAAAATSHRGHQASGHATPYDSGSGCAGPGETGSCSESVQTNNLIRDRIHLRKLHSQYTMGKSQGASGQGAAGGTNGDINSHAYKYRLPFAAGNVFSASMLDTLLYQAFVKDYMITMVRLLLGIDQAPGSGFLSSMRITKTDLWIRTYGRLYQRLCSTTCEIPLGIYRTEPLERNSPPGVVAAGTSGASCGKYQAGSYSFGAFVSQQASYEQATEELERIEISNMVKNRLQDLGMNINDYDDSLTNRNNTFSYVIINPNCDVPLREGDIIYLIRPSPIHSRKLFMHRANSVRYVDHAQQQQQHHPTSQQPPPPPPPSAPVIQSHVMGANSGRSELDGRHHGANFEEIASKRYDLHKVAVPPTRGTGDDIKLDQQNDLQFVETPPTLLRTYFSDGDFSEVLIKVNDHDDLVPSDMHRTDQELREAGSDSHKRRRSSCSDASDSKRSSLSHD